jgi:ribonuclease HII
LLNDQRRGVAELLEQFKRRKAAREKELERLGKMLVEEKKLWQLGYLNIAGIDEAGRGPLAGPVVAAAVVFSPGTLINYMNDSKQLSAKKRELLFEEIIFRSKAYGIGSASSSEIDELNVHAASLLAMRRALEKMSFEPDYILVDGFPLRHCGCSQRAITKGDTKSLSIAAASILAKVTRDWMMQKLHEKFPRYGFDRNMGYGTVEHRQAIAKFGICCEHRRSFKLTGDI